MRFPLRRPPLALPPLAAATDVERPPRADARVLPRPPELLPLAATFALRAAPAAAPFVAAAAGQRIVARLLSAHREYVDRQAAMWQTCLRHQQRLHQAALALAIEGGGPALVAPPPSAPAPHPRRDPWEVAPPLPPRGPRFDRAQLETLASGKISSVFGPKFEVQDAFHVQVRMPEPPLLLCDRVLGIDGEPGTMAQGIIWTETDIREDSWYLHCGRMPGGIFIEAGQADLLLISWLGVDFLNRGERAYRLLGCELMFHGALPQVDDTLRYQIHVDRHATQGAVRLFFFHYDCWIAGQPRISVRNGQAGFFTRAELAGSGGVLWSAADAPYSEPAQVKSTGHATTKTAFSAEEVEAFARGELETCFGSTFDWGWIHSRTPAIPAGRYNLLGAVAQFDPRGGPAGRGYLKAVRRLTPDDWFFKGHFKNDPCMPGTLMAEGCLQAMTFYLVALGYSRDRDGWRSEPVPETKYTFVCRGQATPESRELIYELFVDEVRFIGDQPTLFAHVLCTVDGLKAFKCERLGLRLVKDFPLTSLPRAAWARPARLPVAQKDGLTLDYKSVLACALGHPVDAFGPTFETFTQVLRAPRLPNPPFLFCTHVARAERTPGQRDSKAFVDMLYDLERDAWYFTENSHRVMSLCASMEVALQACGWLSSFVLEPEFATWEPLFRNLDGVGTYYREILPGEGTINTRVQLTSRVVLGEQIIVRFHVLCTIAGERVFECKTTFGSFSPAALADTKGMIPSAAEVAAVKQPGNGAVELAAVRERYRAEKRFTLPGPKLLRLDRVTGLWPKGGAFGLGYIRAEKDVRPRDWVFKAHFYQDPVQPGSIGVESVMQAVKLFLLETETIPPGMDPEFESIRMNHDFEWTYRGQVLPRHKLVVVDFDAKERIVHDDGVTVTGEGRLWVDGRKIYHMTRFGTRLRFVPRENAPRQIDVRPDFEAAFRTIDVVALRRIFADRFGARALVLQDLFLGLIQQFVAGVDQEDPAACLALRDRPVLYLANHQVGVESMLCVALLDALNSVTCCAIAKREHRDSWIGRILAQVRAQTGRDSMVLFDRADPNDLLNLLGGMIGPDGRLTRSLLAHVQGTRALRAGEPVSQVSGALLDLALRCELPVVPLRFVGGLPRAGVAQRLEFPVGFGRQRYALGRPILPDALRALNLRERKAWVIDALNRTGPGLEHDEAAPANAGLAQRVAELRLHGALPETAATLIACLERVVGRNAETDALLAAARPGADAPVADELASLLDAFGIRKKG
jgi:3-hydroxymyristoyl/3-hydroxydecanoyl-(acyl carrier protein) dehydratase